MVFWFVRIWSSNCFPVADVFRISKKIIQTSSLSIQWQVKHLHPKKQSESKCKQIKKTTYLLSLLPTHSVVFALFFEVLHISETTEHLFVHTEHFHAPQKIKQCSKSFKFRFWTKAFIIDFLFFFQPQNLKPLQDDPNSVTKKSALKRKSCSVIKKIK